MFTIIWSLKCLKNIEKIPNNFKGNIFRYLVLSGQIFIQFTIKDKEEQILPHEKLEPKNFFPTIFA